MYFKKTKLHIGLMDSNLENRINKKIPNFHVNAR